MKYLEGRMNKDYLHILSSRLELTPHDYSMKQKSKASSVTACFFIRNPSDKWVQINLIQQINLIHTTTGPEPLEFDMVVQEGTVTQ